MKRGWIAAGLTLAALFGGCGTSSSNLGTAGPETNQTQTTGDASLGGGMSLGDAGVGNATFTTLEDAGGPLQAHIVVNGNGATCGACDVVLVQTQGGTQPYTYSWSDPSWTGPGPFTICPEMATPVSVTVTDSSQKAGELATTDQTTSAATTIQCRPSDGSAPSGGLNGCIASTASGTPDAGLGDGGSVECTGNEVEAGTAWADGGVAASVASSVGATLLAGHAYEYSYDRLLPIVLGQPVTVKVYGSTQPDICQADQLLFTLDLDSSIFNWHQAYCFTPDRDYSYVITNIYIQGVLVFINPLTVGTLCDTCSM
jgi:hypothetical protein